MDARLDMRGITHCDSSVGPKICFSCSTIRCCACRDFCCSDTSSARLCLKQTFDSRCAPFAPGVQGRRQVCSRVDAAPEAYCCARVLWHHLTLQGARLTQLQIRRRGKADAVCYRRADEFARPQNAPWIRPSSLTQRFSAD